MQDIDQKIKSVLQDLREAHAESEKHYAKQIIPGEPTKPHDIYDMALAFDTEKKIHLELNLARSEKFPDRFSVEEVESIKREINELSFNIKAWRNRKFPCQFKE
ncbi:MAG: hypothetical protein WCV93_00400 [Candidatus Shapirobacteria bacterium]|jgi:hypothetical protein